MVARPGLKEINFIKQGVFMKNKNNLNLNLIEHNRRDAMCRYVLLLLDEKHFNHSDDIEFDYIEMIYKDIYYNDTMFTLFIFEDLEVVGFFNDKVLFSSISNKWLGINKNNWRF